MVGITLPYDDRRELSSSSTFLEFNESHDLSSTHAESKDGLGRPENRYWSKSIQYNEQIERKLTSHPAQEKKDDEESKHIEHTPRLGTREARVQYTAQKGLLPFGPDCDISRDIIALNNKYPKLKGPLDIIKKSLFELDKMNGIDISLPNDVATPPKALPTSPKSHEIAATENISTPLETRATSPRTYEDLAAGKNHDSTSNINDTESTTSRDYIYELNPITGNFRQMRSRKHSQRKDKCRVEEAMRNRELFIERIHICWKVGLFLLQGLLAGFSVHALHEVSVKQSTSQFAIQYGKRATGIFRFYFLSVTLCLSGSIRKHSLMTHLIDEDEKVKKSYDKDKKRTIIKISVSILGLIYFGALTLTLLTTKLDFYLKDNLGGDLDQTNVESNISRWKSLSVSRSVVCILGWCIACLELLQRQKRKYMKKPINN